MLCKHTLQIIVQRKALTQQLLVPVQVTAKHSMLDQENGNCGHSKMTRRETGRNSAFPRGRGSNSHGRNYLPARLQQLDFLEVDFRERREWQNN
jgi:hypothetical protein